MGVSHENRNIGVVRLILTLDNQLLVQTADIRHIFLHSYRIYLGTSLPDAIKALEYCLINLKKAGVYTERGEKFGSKDETVPIEEIISQVAKVIRDRGALESVGIKIE